MIYWLLRGFVSTVFLRAGVGKLAHRQDFYWQLRASATLPRWLEVPVSYALPVLEVVAGLGVLLPAVGGRWALALAAVLLAGFAGYAAWVAATGRRVRCFCFGRDDGDIDWATVLRNSAILVGLALASVCPLGRIGPLPVILSLADGFTASLIFIGLFQLFSARREFVDV